MKSCYLAEKLRPGTYLLVSPDRTSIRIKVTLSQPGFPAKMLLEVVLFSHLPTLLLSYTGAVRLFLFNRPSKWPV